MAVRRWPNLYPISVWTLTAGMIYLVGGAIGGNGRWALPAYRYAGYIAVMGSVATAVVIGRRQDSEGNYRFLGWCAAALMYLLLRFEIVRWFEALHYHPMGTFVPIEIIRQQNLTTWLWTGGLWAAWSLALGLVRWRYQADSYERHAA